jgi:quercetin dioxygenase-like cupin family protein
MTDALSTCDVVAWAQQLVELPTDGVVRQTAATADDGLRLVVFGFAAGAELPEHDASCSAIIEVITGEMDLTLDGIHVAAPAGTWIRMPARCPHAVRAVTPALMRLVLLPD